MKALIFNDKLKELAEYGKDLGYETFHVTNADIKSGNYPHDVDIICGGMEFKLLNREKLKEFKNLKYIFLYSVGIDYMDLEYIKEKGIILCNNHGAYSEPIAEWIVYNILQIEKQNKKYLEQQKNHIWKRLEVAGTLYDKHALFLGTGAIAKETLVRLKPFVKTITGVNTSGRKVEGFDEIVKNEDLEKVLPKMDYVVSFLPTTEKTYKTIDSKFFANMKKGSSFINISRGTVVDEEALFDALKSNHLKAAALDVVFKEPLDEKSKLWDLENIYITPHTSDASEDFLRRRARSAAENLKRLKEKEELINIVDFEKGY